MYHHRVLISRWKINLMFPQTKSKSARRYQNKVKTKIKSILLVWIILTRSTTNEESFEKVGIKDRKESEHVWENQLNLKDKEKLLIN